MKKLLLVCTVLPVAGCWCLAIAGPSNSSSVGQTAGNSSTVEQERAKEACNHWLTDGVATPEEKILIARYYPNALVASNSNVDPNLSALKEEISAVENEAIQRLALGLDATALKDRLAVLYSSYQSMMPPPRNNPLDEGGETCATARVIASLPFCDSGSTAGHIGDYAGSCASSGAPDVVYSVTGVAGSVTASLCGSGYDTVIHIWDGCPSSGGVQVACNDDYCSLQSCATWTAVATSTYYIIVDGYSTSSGAYNLNVTTDGVCGTTLCAQPHCPDLSLTAPGTVSGTTVGGANNCSLRPSNDQTVRVVIPATGQWTFSLCTSSPSWDSYILLTTLCCGGTTLTTSDDYCGVLSEIHCFQLDAGVYWLDVEAFSSTGSGAFTLVVSNCPTSGRCCYGTDPCNPSCTIDVQADCNTLGGIWTGGITSCSTNPCPAPLPGDFCCNALPLPVPGTVNGTTVGYTNNYDATCPYSGSTAPDVVYTFTPVQTELVSLSLCSGDAAHNQTNYDTKMYVYAGQCGTGTPVACNDDACSAPHFASAYVSQILCLPVTAGTPYWVVVDGYGGSSGLYTLDATICPPPCQPTTNVQFARNPVPAYFCANLCLGSSTTITICPDAGPFDPTKPPIVTILPGCDPAVTHCNQVCDPAQFTFDPAAWSLDPVGCWVNHISGLSNGCVCITLEGFLAVNLNSFTATAGDRSVTLAWQTQSEPNNDHFEIFRGDLQVARIEAQGSSSAGGDYTWTDRDVTNGTTYHYSLVAVDMNGGRGTLRTADATPSAPVVVTEYSLYQNYPNPFNPTTSITFDLVEGGMVHLTVYNIVGQEVAHVVNSYQSAGRHVVNFDATGLTSGLYLYRIEANGYVTQKKMLLMK